MANFRISQKILCTWLWAEEDVSKGKEQIIMDKIKEGFNYNQKQLQQIEKQLKKTFLPHYRRQCIRYKHRRDDMMNGALVFMNNYFIVKFQV